jgi:hypothetical protein
MIRMQAAIKAEKIVPSLLPSCRRSFWFFVRNGWPALVTPSPRRWPPPGGIACFVRCHFPATPVAAPGITPAKAFEDGFPALDGVKHQ